MSIELQILEAISNHPRKDRVREVRLGVARYNALVVELKEARALYVAKPPIPPGEKILIAVDYDSMDGMTLVEGEE